jgi:hypothetical protein
MFVGDGSNATLIHSPTFHGKSVYYLLQTVQVEEPTTLQSNKSRRGQYTVGIHETAMDYLKSMTKP